MSTSTSRYDRAPELSPLLAMRSRYIKRRPSMGGPNWKNRTMWTGDNLPIMRGWREE